MSHMGSQETRSRLVAAIACACFALQLVLVPLHLALHDHVSTSGVAHHFHGPYDHGHSHEPADVGDPGERHSPHPLEDHQEQLAEPVVLPKWIHPPAAPSSALAGVLDLDFLVRESALREKAILRPPPPRGAAAPRGPPSLV